MSTQDSEDKRPSAVKESLSIPQSARDVVDERDHFKCRMCGKYLGPESRAIHHIIYGGDARGAGGRRVHDPDEMVTLCWMWGGNCHDRAHGNKHKYQPLLLRVVQMPGVTVFQLERWEANRARRHVQAQRPLGRNDDHN